LFSQNVNPTGSLTVSALVAALPLLALLITSAASNGAPIGPAQRP